MHLGTLNVGPDQAFELKKETQADPIRLSEQKLSLSQAHEPKYRVIIQPIAVGLLQTPSHEQ